MTTYDVYNAAELGRSISAIRHARGWTQAYLAEWLGVSRPTVIALERGGPVNVQVAMKAITLLGSRVVIVPKSDAIDR